MQLTHRHLSLVLAVVTIFALACGDPDAPEEGSGPAIDVVGRVTLPSGGPAAGVTVTGVTYEAFLCDLPGGARGETSVSTSSGSDGMYRLRVRVDTAGARCVGLFAQSPAGSAAAARVADARPRPPFVVLRVDLSLLKL